MHIKKKTRRSRQAHNGYKQSRQLSLLPEPDFNPKIPSKGTLPYRALSMLLQRKKITHPSFQNKTDSWRLAAAIDILKNDLGWPVQTEDIIHRTTKKPKKRTITRYFLSLEIIKTFQDNGGAL